MPIEGIGSAAEKAAPLVKFPVLMRIVLPGTLAALCIYPFVHGWITWLPPIPSVTREWGKLVYTSVAVCVLGLFTSWMRDLVYKTYSDRLLWPLWLFRTLCALQESRVQRLLAEQESLDEGSIRYDKVWQTLRLYPVDEKNNPYASHPTLLGNIVASYETYPWTRYGMDAVFYWPRIWLLLEKEKKEELDASWSLADGLLSLSTVAFIGGLAWAMAGIARLGGFPLLHLGYPLDSTLSAALSSLSLLLLGYFIYRVSLGFHVRKGETFKAVFDLSRERLNPMLKASPEEIAQWKKAWAYLQFLVVEQQNPKIPSQPTLVANSAPPSAPKHPTPSHHSNP